VRYMPWWGTYRPYAKFPPVKLETTRKHCTRTCSEAGLHWSRGVAMNGMGII